MKTALLSIMLTFTLFQGCQPDPGPVEEGPVNGTFRAFHHIQATYRPGHEARALYEELLPAPLTMPEEPEILFTVLHFTRMSTALFRPYREAVIFLTGHYGGRDYRHIITQPVTSQLANQGGIAMGLPKYMADGIDLIRNPDGRVSGEVRDRGAVRLSMAFQPTSPMQKGLDSGYLDNVRFQFSPPWYRYPDVRPSEDFHTVYSVYVTDRIDSQPGMVRIRLHPQDPWAGLLPPEGITVPGLYSEWEGRRDMKTGTP